MALFGNSWISDSLIQDNTSDNEGGGLYSLSATTLSQASLLSNTASVGGALMTSPGTLSTTGGEVSHNRANAGGGLYSSAYSDPTHTDRTDMDNNIFGGNARDSGAADIALGDGAVHTLVGRHNTFASGNPRRAITILDPARRHSGAAWTPA